MKCDCSLIYISDYVISTKSLHYSMEAGPALHRNRFCSSEQVSVRGEEMLVQPPNVGPFKLSMVSAGPGGVWESQ